MRICQCTRKLCSWTSGRSRRPCSRGLPSHRSTLSCLLSHPHPILDNLQLNMGGGQTVASFAVGALAGGVVAALYYVRKDETTRANPTLSPTPSPVPAPITLREPTTSISTTADAPTVHNARGIMKYGFPGPVNDVLYRRAYGKVLLVSCIDDSLKIDIPFSVASYNRANRNPNWVAEHLTARSFSAPPSSPNSLPSPASLMPESDDTSLDAPDRHKASFREDLDIPRMFRAKLKDYLGSGFDRYVRLICDVENPLSELSQTL